MSKSQKTRLDRLLVERGLAGSREKAQALILAGDVCVNHQKIEKCGAAVDMAAELRVVGKALRYASRAGLKLEAALDHFHLDPKGRTCIDLGASTGGFTDCLLQRGAAHVFAVDAGTNQLDWRIRQNDTVTVLEKTNARYLKPEQIGDEADFVTMDVSFISSTLILPALPPLLKAGADVIILVKPQFEVGREQVGKGGIVREPALHLEAIQKVAGKLRELRFSVLSGVESLLPGAQGNREFFIHAVWMPAALSDQQSAFSTPTHGGEKRSP